MTGQSLTTERKTTLTTLFNQAIHRHPGGHVLAAAQAYERVLRDLPTHADVLDLYGTALFQRGAAATGRAHVTASLKRRPVCGAAWNHLGALDRGLRDDGPAQRAFQRSAVFGDRDETDRGLRLNRRAATMLATLTSTAADA